MCFDSNLLEETVRQATSRAHRRNVEWRPQVHRDVPAGFCDVCLAHGAVGVSVSTIADAAALALPANSSILISLPPAFSELSLLDQFPHSVELILTIDHYVQAERIAAAVRNRRNQLPVLLLLQAHRSGPGIRPGQDAARLARGVAGLNGLRVAGLAVEIADDGESESIIRSAAHTQRALSQAGIDGGLVSAAAEIDLIPPADSVVTEIRDRRPGQAGDREQPSVWLETDVISRPSLEVAVVGVGRTLLETHADYWFPDFPEAQVLRCLDDCVVMSATGDAQRLTIGDVVRIACSRFPNLSR